MDLSQLQFAMFGLTMIAPKWAANVNAAPPLEPDDPPPPKSALEVPNVPREDICGTREPQKDTESSHWLLAPDPMYSGTYIEPHQFAHHFALWMVENTDNDWLMAWQVDRKMAKFCGAKNYRHPDTVMIRSILGDMMGGNYIARAYARSAQFRHLETWAGTKKQIAVYRFTLGLARHLTKPAKLQAKINDIEANLDQLTSCSTLAHVSRESQRVSHVSKSRGVKKAGKNRLAARKKKPTKSAHYLDDASWQEAA